MSKKKDVKTPVSEENSGQTPLSSEESTQEMNAALEDRLRDQEDKFLRLYAEFDNFRKRSARDRAEYLASASQEMVLAMLPVLDDFERAMANNAKVEDIETIRGGFNLIFTKLSQILESKGLKPINALHQPFDYELHEAIANIPVEDPEMKGKVIDQVEKGFYLNDKVIRYAKVAVGQ